MRTPPGSGAGLPPPPLPIHDRSTSLVRRRAGGDLSDLVMMRRLLLRPRRLAKERGRGRRETGGVMEVAVAVRRWRSGFWSIAAIDESRGRYTLIQGKGSAFARVVVVDPAQCTEATSETAP